MYWWELRAREALPPRLQAPSPDLWGGAWCGQAWGWEGCGGAPGGAQGPHQEGLEELEGAAQPHIQVGLQPCGRAVEGIGHGQKGVGPHREELPVVGARSGDGLVGLEEPRPRVPLVDDAVNVMVVAWKPSSIEEGRQASAASCQRPGTRPHGTLPQALQPVQPAGP